MAGRALVSLAEITEAARRLAPVVVRTPLAPVPGLSRASSPGQAGVASAHRLVQAARRLHRDQRRGQAARQRGVIAHSSGNHGHAVAYAAALLGVHAVVVVPRTAPKSRPRRSSATAPSWSPWSPRWRRGSPPTEELAARHGYVLIPPFDDRAVIAGQGTVGLEIAADCPQADLVVVPVSGGGLISGIAAAIRALPSGGRGGRRGTRTRRGRPRLLPPRRAGRVARGGGPAHIADALRVEQVGALPFAHIRELVTDMITVTEEEMLAAVRLLAQHARLVAEPGGAAAVAACLFRSRDLPRGQRAGSRAIRRQHRPAAAGEHPRPGLTRNAGAATWVDNTFST